MNEYNARRRDILKATGIGVLGLAGASTLPGPAAGHESVEASATDLLGPIQVAADSEAGFNYPYYLYVPEATQDEPVPMLVEPNNTGTVSDDFEEHRTSARQFVEGTLGWTRTYSEALTVPLLVPVFPRPRSDPVDGNHYVHALDETTMNLDGGELERVDLQLRNMVDHAQGILRDMEYPIADDVMLNGFSASGNFVNRFTALHPELVRSVTAGGINGTPILPLEEDEGHTLNYHIGVADVDAITGEPFDRDTWREVAQFIYIGGEDENDTIPYSDAWSDRQREIALDVYGEHMQDDRMPYCESVYDDAGANAEFEIYDGVGHRQPVQVQRDIVDFHREAGRLKQFSFAQLPSTDDVELQFDVLLHDDRDRFDLRVRSDERGDLTESAVTVPTGEWTHPTVDLTSGLDPDESITAVAVPAGTTDDERAVASVERVVGDTPSVEVLDRPTVAEQSVTVRYASDADIETESPIHLFVGPSGGGPSQLLATFPPGASGQESSELSPDELGTSLESGTQLQVELVNVDAGESIATDSFTVGAGEEGGAEPAVSVSFDTQPTAGRDAVGIEYAVGSDYEPDSFLSLQLRSGETSVLLGAIEPGAATTDQFSLEKIPLEAGDEAEVLAVDRGPVDRSRTVVVGDAADAVDVQFTGRPSEDDPSATVEYRIDESYQVEDVLTLRVYSEGVPGSAPGEALTLLEPGGAGAETFTVGEDVDPGSGELIAAVIDEEPFALASTADEPGATEFTAATEGAGTDGGGTGGDDTQTSADGPGFGAVGALASFAGLSYFLKRRGAGTDRRADDEH